MENANIEDAPERARYIVAYLFVKSSYEEAARAKNQDGLEIILRTVQELIDGKIE